MARNVRILLVVGCVLGLVVLVNLTSGLFRGRGRTGRDVVGDGGVGGGRGGRLSDELPAKAKSVASSSSFLAPFVPPSSAPSAGSVSAPTATPTTGPAAPLGYADSVSPQASPPTLSHSVNPNDDMVFEQVASIDPFSQFLLRANLLEAKNFFLANDITDKETLLALPADLINEIKGLSIGAKIRIRMAQANDPDKHRGEDDDARLDQLAQLQDAQDALLHLVTESESSATEHLPGDMLVLPRNGTTGFSMDEIVNLCRFGRDMYVTRFYALNSNDPAFLERHYLAHCYPIEISTSQSARSSGHCSDFVNYVYYADAALAPQFDGNAYRRKAKACPTSYFLHGEYPIIELFLAGLDVHAKPEAEMGSKRDNNQQVIQRRDDDDVVDQPVASVSVYKDAQQVLEAAARDPDRNGAASVASGQDDSTDAVKGSDQRLKLEDSNGTSEFPVFQKPNNNKQSKLLPQGHRGLRNVWMPNLEQIKHEQMWLFRASYMILCKVHIMCTAARAYLDDPAALTVLRQHPQGAPFAPYEPLLRFMSHSSPDLRSLLGGADAVAREAGLSRFTRFLHAYGHSGRKHTLETLACWRAHPEFPELAIVGNEARADHRRFRAHNIKLYSRLSTDALRRLQLSHGVSVCASSMEGYGHYINEPRSLGFLVLTTDHAPMNEFVEDGVDGLLIPGDSRAGAQQPEGYQGMAPYFVSPMHVPAENICQAVKRVLNMTLEERAEMGARSRLRYERDTDLMVKNLKELRAEIVDHMGGRFDPKAFLKECKGCRLSELIVSN
ncbi:hypothetical protein BC830DRAFT_1113287 [Chytriomyces sp. MP71]|nr:hypothetical protein BC830DRAFT_1113287 [Chytriomyces sp. MP71]